jgi:hypothetical protein
MRSLLHILTKPDDALARSVIEAQQQASLGSVTVVDLTEGQPNYDALVDSLFTSDSVEVW